MRWSKKLQHKPGNGRLFPAKFKVSKFWKVFRFQKLIFGFFSKDLSLYNGETFEMMARRWSKLEKDFKTRPCEKQADCTFDISKIPDIYDCIKYDSLHNAQLPIPCKNELYAASKALADVVVPQVSHFEASFGLFSFKPPISICCRSTAWRLTRSFESL